MTLRDSYCHGFKMDRTIRLATDSLMNHVMEPEFNPTPPPAPGFFLELNGGIFLLLNAQDLTLL